MNQSTHHWRTQYALDYDGEINVDLFAGGGGASTGLEMGLKRPVHIAINHDLDAVSMHQANHPHAQHYVSDVYEVDPREACAGRPVGNLHASPDCTHFSQAKGGQSRKRAIRSLSWVVTKWAGMVRPRVITLENVEQILQWSPLVAKRCPATGRVVTLDKIQCPSTGRLIHRVANKGEQVPVDNQFLVPDRRRRGHNWKHFVESLRRLGYEVQWKTLKASSFGAPTRRERLYLVARCDGQPIVWPQPSHFEKPTRGQKRVRPAADCIDWSLPSKSIFNRKKPLAAATMKRIAKGIDKFVLQSADPFIVPVTHSGSVRVHDINEPFRTVITANRGEFMLAAPHLVKFRFDHAGHSLAEAMPTVTAGGDCRRPAGAAHALGLSTAYMAQMNGGFYEGAGHDLRSPASTVTNSGSQQQLITAHLITQRNNMFGTPADASLNAITAGGLHHGLVECRLSPEHEEGALRVAAFMINYYGKGLPRDLQQPLDTITTRDRLALVTVVIKGIPFVIVDICLRMLDPRELYRAQGFPDSYIIDHGHDGRVFSKSKKVRFVGNSVSPLPMAALAAVNDHPVIESRMEGAA